MVKSITKSGAKHDDHLEWRHNEPTAQNSEREREKNDESTISPSKSHSHVTWVNRRRLTIHNPP